MEHDPPPPEQVFFLTRWRASFGAELVYVGYKDLELAVHRPPATPEAIAALVPEQLVQTA